ncbi:MAG: hypothetical protein KGJ13_06945 [Patescibacteria group bacterium]|nr:hypothetical protein [Patescibacteria group bacterium]
MATAAKAVVMAERADAGFGLWHPRDTLRRYRRGETEWYDLVDAQRTITTRDTNPNAPANGAAIPTEIKRIHERNRKKPG